MCPEASWTGAETGKPGRAVLPVFQGNKLPTSRNRGGGGVKARACSALQPRSHGGPAHVQACTPPSAGEKLPGQGAASLGGQGARLANECGDDWGGSALSQETTMRTMTRCQTRCVRPAGKRGVWGEPRVLRGPWGAREGLGARQPTVGSPGPAPVFSFLPSPTAAPCVHPEPGCPVNGGCPLVDSTQTPTRYHLSQLSGTSSPGAPPPRGLRARVWGP